MSGSRDRAADRAQMTQQARLQHQLTVQSQQIERVFAQHQLSAHIAGGAVRPRSIRYDLSASLAQGWERLRDLTYELKTALNVPDVRLSREDGQLRLHITRLEEPPVALLDLLPLLPDLPPLTATLGLDENGRPVLLDFDNPDVTHVLIAGEENAGKTTLLRTLAMSLALKNRQSHLQMLVIDLVEGNGRNAALLDPLAYLPHMLTGISRQLDEAIEILAFAVGEVMYRREQQTAFPKIALLIDKASRLLDLGGEPVRESLSSLLQHGAGVGVHVILGARHPETIFADNMFRAHLPVRLVGQAADEMRANVAAGLMGTQAEYLLGQGDFLAVVGGEITHFQAAHIGDYDLHMSLEALHRNRPQPLLARPISVRPFLAADADESRQPGQSRLFYFDGQEVDWQPETGE